MFSHGAESGVDVPLFAPSLEGGTIERPVLARDDLPWALPGFMKSSFKKGSDLQRGWLFFEKSKSYTNNTSRH